MAFDLENEVKWVKQLAVTLVLQAIGAIRAKFNKTEPHVTVIPNRIKAKLSSTYNQNLQWGRVEKIVATRA